MMGSFHGRAWAVLAAVAIAAAVAPAAAAADFIQIRANGVPVTAAMPSSSVSLSASLAGNLLTSSVGGDLINQNAAGRVSASATASLSYPVATAGANSIEPANGLGRSDLTFYVAVIGPRESLVDLDITGRVNTVTTVDPRNLGSPSGDFSRSVASLTTFGVFGLSMTSWDCEVARPFGCVSEDFQANSYISTYDETTLNAGSGTVDLSHKALKIELTAAAISDDEGDSAFASIDPLITIDPSTPDAGLYQIYISPAYLNGVAPEATGGVPEPAAWTLMLLGFGGVGAGLRRRRHLAEPCAAA